MYEARKRVPRSTVYSNCLPLTGFVMKVVRTGSCRLETLTPPVMWDAITMLPNLMADMLLFWRYSRLLTNSPSFRKKLKTSLGVSLVFRPSNSVAGRLIEAVASSDATSRIFVPLKVNVFPRSALNPSPGNPKVFTSGYIAMAKLFLVIINVSFVTG